ncbi:MAG: ice-binding family protein [Bacilli bacterium]|nr:ice-binding family protein [Bacilli bacterium]
MKKTIFYIISLMLILPILTVSALTTINQGTTKDFAVLAGSTITNTGSSTINGDIGLYPGTSLINKEGITLDGTIHLTDSVADVAKNDLTTAYNQVSGLLPVSRIATQLGGQTLKPGIYDSADGTFNITGTLILDAEGDSNAIFIFKTSSTLITATSSKISLINNAQHCNVYWKVGSSATLGTNSSFVGHIYALSSITATTGAKIQGQLLARDGAVTLDSNTIINTVCAVTTTVNGGELPNTSTNLYNMLIIGILMVTIGLSSLVINKRYVKNKK